MDGTLDFAVLPLVHLWLLRHAHNVRRLACNPPALSTPTPKDRGPLCVSEPAGKLEVAEGPSRGLGSSGAGP